MLFLKIEKFTKKKNLLLLKSVDNAQKIAERKEKKTERERKNDEMKCIRLIMCCTLSCSSPLLGLHNICYAEQARKYRQIFRR